MVSEVIQSHALFQVLFNKSNHGSANLDGHFIAGYFISVFDQNESSKFRIVVIDPEFILIAVELDIGVESGNRNIRNSGLTLMPATLKLINKIIKI